jgi:hypothetical protein
MWHTEHRQLLESLVSNINRIDTIISHHSFDRMEVLVIRLRMLGNTTTSATSPVREVEFMVVSEGDGGLAPGYAKQCRA